MWRTGDWVKEGANMEYHLEEEWWASPNSTDKRVVLLSVVSGKGQMVTGWGESDGKETNWG